MKYTTLGRTGVEVSRICVGTMNFGGRTPADDAHTILDLAFDGGVNFIDTANVYGHEPLEFVVGRGRSESIIGSWMSGKRDQVVLATKMYFPMSEAVGSMGPTRRNIIAECEASLRRLGTDHIDLYQLHHPSNDVPIDETLRALDDLVTAGKVRYIGTSSFAAWQLMEGLWAASTHALTPFVSEQPVYNLLDRRVERELVGMAQSYGIGLLTWSPLAGGLLATVPATAGTVDEGSRYDAFWTGRRSAITAEVIDVVSRLQRLADEAGLALADLAQSWLLHRRGVTSVIAGPRTVEHMVSSLAAVEVTLDDALVAAIDDIVRPGGVTMPQYGADGMAWIPWGPHRVAWR